MFFKKKDDNKALPDLPPSPTLPKLPISTSNNTKAPLDDFSSIPELKKAPVVESEEEKEENYIPKNFKAVEMEEWGPEKEEKPVRITKIDKAPSMEEREIPLQRETPPSPAERNTDIFVRLDKFRNARRALEEIKIRTEEIDALLKKIRETKLREEQELTGWEKEITSIKSRVQEVSSNIFEKVE